MSTVSSLCVWHPVVRRGGSSSVLLLSALPASVDCEAGVDSWRHSVLFFMSSVCRLCAEQSDQTINIFSSTGHSLCLPEKINKCLPVVVSRDQSCTGTLSTMKCVLTRWPILLWHPVLVSWQYTTPLHQYSAKWQQQLIRENLIKHQDLFPYVEFSDYFMEKYFLVQT